MLKSFVVDHQDLVSTTQEIVRRRILTKQAGNDFRNTFADVFFLDSYGRTPTLDDIRKGNSRALAFITEDESGRTIRTVASPKSPYRVYARWLDVDVYVFVRIPTLENASVVGWLPSEEVEQAPVKWFENDEGERVDYCHEIDVPFMIHMPEQFDFDANCQHRGVWDYRHDGWECFLCERYVYDQDSIDLFARYDQKKNQEKSDGG